MLVLIVDDDSDDTYFFCEAIARIDTSISCEICHEPDDVPKHLANQPQFVFVDNYMGGVTGEDILRKINHHANGNKPKVVMYSSVFSPDQLKIYDELGCYAIMKKSSSFPDLISSLKNILCNSK
jgi:DNA-binding NarL/FixJ family response regulator